MAKIAIVVIPLFGHINTTVSVGQVLLDRGHDVRWVTARPLSGLSIPPKGKIHYTNQYDASVKELLDNVKNGGKRSGLEGTRYIMEDVLLPLNTLMYKGLEKVFEQEKPDLVLHDEQTYAGAVVAFQKHIPYVTNYSVPSGIFESLEDGHLRSWYFSCLLDFQKNLGVETHEIISHSEDLGVVFCPKNFNNLTDLLAAQKFVGPCIDIPRSYSVPFDHSQLQKGKKSILVSLGTLLEGEGQRFFNRVIEDFQGSPYTIIISANAQHMDWPPNFIASENLPQLEVLKHVDAVITHGGANTVCETVGNGKPMVVIPMAFDQYHLADQVEKSKIGIRLRYKRLKAGDMKNACDTILNPDENYRSNVEKLAVDFKNGGGATQAATYIENKLQTEKCQNTYL